MAAAPRKGISLKPVYRRRLFEDVATRKNQDLFPSWPKGAGSRADNQEHKKRGRVIRRAELKVGEEFRLLDLSDEIAIVPAKLLCSRVLTPPEMLSWAIIFRGLAKEDAAFPSSASRGGAR